MKTKEENMGKEEELPMKKELLSDEELLEVAAGHADDWPPYDTDPDCYKACIKEGKSGQECQQRCQNSLNFFP